MMTPGLENSIVDRDARLRNVRHLRERGVVLPTISELADPVSRLSDRIAALGETDPDAGDARNLFRVHWHNGEDRKNLVEVPQHLVLGEALTGVKARIVVALGDRFPMITCHKVLAAYGCLIPRLMSGVFDATHHRAIWPSTGNYCRGGVAISRLLGCRSVAVLPEGRSRERFDWLNRWLADPADIYRTPGTESNVKEIYDACRRLARDPENLILNQFAEYGNYIIHRAVTGPAIERIFRHLDRAGNLRPSAFVAATGSAGTLAAGDHLKATLGVRIGAIEALECPTMLRNGYGEHNIQGIGDKHVPLIHNVMNTDFVIGVSDRSTDGLNLVFNSDAGREYLGAYRGMDREAIASLASLGLSAISNILGAVKYARYMDLDQNDVVMTVATDGAPLYRTELDLAAAKYLAAPMDCVTAAETFGRAMLGAATDNLIEMRRDDRERVFNLGYYTWVEQQGISLEDFDARRDPAFWNRLMDLVEVWDGMIDEFNTA